MTEFYSKHFELELLQHKKTTCLIKNMKKIFARYGIPQEIVSDNGSQYTNTRNLFDSTHQCKEFAHVSDSNIQLALQNIHNPTVQPRGQYRQQNRS